MASDRVPGKVRAGFRAFFYRKVSENVVKPGVSDALGVVVSDWIVALDGQCLASASLRLALQCNSASQCQPKASTPVPSVAKSG